jgi:hypothetical protein
MRTETIQTAAKYLIALVVIGGCFLIIYQAAPDADLTQPWTIIGLIVGWIIRDSAGNDATSNVARIAAAQPTVTTAGDPPRTTVTPTPQVEGDR